MVTLMGQTKFIAIKVLNYLIVQGWTGPLCNLKKCPLDCSSNGICENGLC